VASPFHNLNPEKALIWRIIHRDNLPWVLAHGLHCGNSALRATNWVSIGNTELIHALFCDDAQHPFWAWRCAAAQQR
jgi:hypothetical protein